MINEKLLPFDDYIIEQGEKYIKYNSGSMICWGSTNTTINVTAQSNNMYYGSYIFAFPQTFISVPTVMPSVYQTGGVFLAGLGNTATQKTTETQVRVISAASAPNVNLTFGYIAIGKWK